MTAYNQTNSQKKHNEIILNTEGKKLNISKRKLKKQSNVRPFVAQLLNEEPFEDSKTAADYHL